MIRYRWPGNVRELENLIERLTILVSSNAVHVSDLPEKLNQMSFPHMELHHRGADNGAAPERAAGISASMAFNGAGFEFSESGIDLNVAVSTMERNLIQKALEKTGGVRSRAAQLLGLNRTTLLEKMKKMGIEMQKM